MNALHKMALAALFLFSIKSQAALITLEFEGYVDYFSTGGTGIVGTNLARGDSFTGALTYDTNVVYERTQSFSLGDLYEYSSSSFMASLVFENSNGNLSIDISGTSSIDLYDDHCCNQDTLYFGRSEQNWNLSVSGLTGSTSLSRVNAFRMAKDNSVFDFSVNPPPIPTSFDYDSTRDGSATNGFYLVFDDGNNNSPVAYTRFTKISSSSVPLPSSLSLFLLACVVLVFQKMVNFQDKKRLTD